MSRIKYFIKKVILLSIFLYFPFRRLFLAVALDNFDICVIDFLGRQIYRKFTTPSSPFMDACFSPSNIWLTAASADGCVRTWDLVTGE